MSEIRLIDASKIENQKIHYESEQKENVELFLGGAMAVMGMIHNAPTIDPESLRPETRLKYDALGRTVACLNCSGEVKLGEYDNPEDFKYCPFCGFKIVGWDYE
nr:MAG TPA: DNA REPAIR HELICASE RAD25, SSL2, PRE-INITIATION COMPLEX, RNA POLYMERASE.0A [Caudoviricetes sp.]